MSGESDPVVDDWPALLAELSTLVKKNTPSNQDNPERFHLLGSNVQSFSKTHAVIVIILGTILMTAGRRKEMAKFENFV